MNVTTIQALSVFLSTGTTITLTFLGNQKSNGAFFQSKSSIYISVEPS